MPFNLTETNPWLGFAQDYPEGMYRAFLPQSPSKRFTDYFKGQYGNVYGDYMGELSRMAMQGQPPSMNFEDYLTNYPFLREWWSLGPGQRGQRQPSRVNWNV
uniref:Uncharacterized protein n=1 Tax=viral metagenome TaxID=1070528 RepID=A0A6H1ZZX0_9ZZZZ